MKEPGIGDFAKCIDGHSGIVKAMAEQWAGNNLQNGTFRYEGRKANESKRLQELWTESV